MRGTFFLVTAALFACAQGGGNSAGTEPLAAPAADAGVEATSRHGPAALARYCDPALDASAGITLTDTGACPGLLPAAPDCVAEVALCEGSAPSPAGPAGSFASDATSDAEGAVALACTSSDSAHTSYRVGLPAASYAPAASLGEAVLPLDSGFVSVPQSRPAPIRFLAHDGTVAGSVSRSTPLVIAGHGAVLIASAEPAGGGMDLRAQLFNGAGTALGDPMVVAHLSTAFGMGGAADVDGNVLLTWTTYDRFSAFAQWFGPDGAPLTPAFDVSGWAGHAAVAAALAGGGVAVADALQKPWGGVLTAGSTSISPVPAWLASRGAFTLVKGGRAMLFDDLEVVSASGASCGAIAFADGLPTRAGADGTLFHRSAGGKGFRLYPQLLR